MRIAISTLVTPAAKAGVGNYVVNLIRALQEIDPENEYYVFVGQDTAHLFDITAPRFRRVLLRIAHDPRWLMRPAYYAWQNSVISWHLRRYKVDVLHLPNLSPLLVRFVPTLITIHDVTEYKVVKYSAARQKYRMFMLPIAARRADRVIVVSESAKQELIDLTGIPSAKVDVTHEAPSIKPAGGEDSVGRESLRELGVRDEYILYVGNMQAHKNLARLIQAFALEKQRHRIPHQLVLVGSIGREAASLLALADGLNVRKDIVMTGYVPDAILAGLYAHSSLFAFPSISEGFGIPVVEAMACGSPVVTSNTSSLPEVAGNAAVLVDPLSVEAIAAGIWQVVGDDERRRELISMGRKRAGDFSWQQCAVRTLESYHRAAATNVKR